MPFNASGVFQRLFNWRNDRDAGIKILAERMDQEMDGIVAGINDIVQADINFKGPITGVYGTVTAPAFSFQEDPDTGVYHSGTNKLAASAGGAQVLELRQDEVETLVNFKKGTFAIAGDFVSFEDGDHWITYGESGHDFGLRAGNKHSGSDDEITSNGHGAIAVSLNHQAVDPEFKVRIGNSGALGATVTWAKELVAKASGTLTWGGHTVWHANNGGPGSGLDADLLDGYQHTDFMKRTSGVGTDIRLGKYQYLSDYDDGTGATSGLRCYVRNGTWYVNPNVGETNAVELRLQGNRVVHAGVAYGTVGQFVFAYGVKSLANNTVAGSALHPSSSNGHVVASTLSGTWRCLGHTNSTTDVTLWQRVA